MCCSKFRALARQSGSVLVSVLLGTAIASMLLLTLAESSLDIANSQKTKHQREQARTLAMNQLITTLKAFDITQASASSDIEELREDVTNDSAHSLARAFIKRKITGHFRQPAWHELSRRINSRQNCPEVQSHSNMRHLVSRYRCNQRSFSPARSTIILGNLNVRGELRLPLNRSPTLSVLIRGELAATSLVITHPNVALYALGNIRIHNLELPAISKALIHSAGGTITVPDSVRSALCTDPQSSQGVRLQAKAGVFFVSNSANLGNNVGCPAALDPALWPPFTIVGEELN